MSVPQEGSYDNDYLLANVETADGNVVVGGVTEGGWAQIMDGSFDIAVAKLNVDNGEEIWRYQVRQTRYSRRVRRDYFDFVDGIVDDLLYSIPPLTTT